MKFILSLLLFFQTISFATPLKEMISQMIVVGFVGHKLEDKWVNQIRLDIKFNRIGGVLFLGKNIISKAQFTKLVQDIKNIKGESPTLLVITQEGGDKSPLTKEKGFNHYLTQKSIADTQSLDKAKNIYSKMAKELKNIGINLNLAPTVNRCSLGLDECFSKYSSMITSYSMNFIEAFRNENIFTCMKYFPSILKEDSAWTFEELRPYFDMIKTKKAKSIMVSHAKIEKFDETYPSSMSKKIVDDILRKYLKYDGVVISKNMMDKEVMDFPLKERVIKSVNAGIDILLFEDYFVQNSNTPRVVRDIILKAVANKQISQKRIEESYRRIMALKKAF